MTSWETLSSCYFSLLFPIPPLSLSLHPTSQSPQVPTCPCLQTKQLSIALRFELLHIKGCLSLKYRILGPHTPERKKKRKEIWERALHRSYFPVDQSSVYSQTSLECFCSQSTSHTLQLTFSLATSFVSSSIHSFSSRSSLKAARMSSIISRACIIQNYTIQHSFYYYHIEVCREYDKSSKVYYIYISYRQKIGQHRNYRIIHKLHYDDVQRL